MLFRLYQSGVDFANVLPRVEEPPKTTKEQRPDLVSQKIRRYEDKPQDWQVR